MTTKILPTLLCLLTVLLAPDAGAAPMPFWRDPLPQPPIEQPPVGIPDPVNLSAHWWRYFQVEGSELDDHIIATSQRLAELLDTLPEETAQAVRSTVDRIETQMDILANARSRTPPKPPEFGQPSERYTIRELLDLIERLQKEQQALRARRAEVAASEKAIKAALRGIDTRMAGYLGLAPDASERLRPGLGIMVDRLSVSVAETQLRLRKAELAAQETAVARLLKEREAASERLSVQPEDLERLAAGIEETEAILEQTRQRLIQQQTTVYSVVTTTPAEQATAPYRQQQLLNTEVVEAINEARLIRLHMERELTRLLLDGARLDSRAVRAQFAEWNQHLAVIHEERDGWTGESQNERDRADAALAATAGLVQGVESLIRVVHRDRLSLARETLVALEQLGALLGQAEALDQLMDSRLAQREGGMRDWLERAELALKQASGALREWGSRSLFKIDETPVTAFGLLRVVVILFVAWLISHWFRRGLRGLAERRTDATHAVYTVGRLTHYVLITLGLLVGLSSIGIDFTNLAVMAGAIGIGIGFGLQSIVKNFLSGILLLFERSLKVGDFVELASGITGEVRAINVRSTVINTNDDVDIVVPNSEFIDHEVTNWTLVDNFRRIHVPFRVAYDADTDLVRKVVLEAADDLPHTLKTKKPGIWLAGFGDSGLECELVIWITPAAVKRPGAVDADYRWAIEAALRKHRIPIPLPQRDLHLRNGFPMPPQSQDRVPLEQAKPLLEKVASGPGRVTGS